MAIWWSTKFSDTKNLSYLTYHIESYVLSISSHFVPILYHYVGTPTKIANYFFPLWCVLQRNQIWNREPELRISIWGNKAYPPRLGLCGCPLVIQYSYGTSPFKSIYSTSLANETQQISLPKNVRHYNIKQFRKKETCWVFSGRIYHPQMFFLVPVTRTYGDIEQQELKVPGSTSEAYHVTGRCRSDGPYAAVLRLHIEAQTAAICLTISSVLAFTDNVLNVWRVGSVVTWSNPLSMENADTSSRATESRATFCCVAFEAFEGTGNWGRKALVDTSFRSLNQFSLLSEYDMLIYVVMVNLISEIIKLCAYTHIYIYIIMYIYI